MFVYAMKVGGPVAKSLTNMTAYNITFGCNFFGTKSADIDRDGCWRREGAHKNKQKEHISWILYI